MFQAVRHVGGWVLWANLHLLFWLSLMPFTTELIGENDFGGITVLIYTLDLLMCAVGYYLLVLALLAQHGKTSDFARALGSDVKEKSSLAAYVAAVPLSLYQPLLSLGLIAIVALIWVVPDRRFTRATEKA